MILESIKRNEDGTLQATVDPEQAAPLEAAHFVRRQFKDTEVLEWKPSGKKVSVRFFWQKELEEVSGQKPKEEKGGEFKKGGDGDVQPSDPDSLRPKRTQPMRVFGDEYIFLLRESEGGKIFVARCNKEGSLIGPGRFISILPPCEGAGRKKITFRRTSSFVGGGRYEMDGDNTVIKIVGTD